MPLIKAKANSASPNGFEIPTLIKTTAGNNDYFVGIDSSGSAYRISKSNLLAGLSSGGTTTTAMPLNAVTGFDGVKEFLIEISNDYLSH